MNEKEKVLTISVAAYNVETVLEKALSSCAVPAVMEDIEVLVVNDGSRDGTSTLAHGYEARYPGTFRVIDKENGGYGSTVNASMAEARGKYFRLLDGDDWFLPEGLERLVTFLRSCEADVVLTGRREVTGEEDPGTHSRSWWYETYADRLKDQTVPLEELEPFAYGMWFLTYRTAVLREHPFQLPEHMLYTDSMFVTFALPWIRNIAFQNYDLYCYRIGQQGQSVSPENRVKHLDDTVRGYEILLDFYREQKELPEANQRFLNVRMGQYYQFLIRTILMAPASPDGEKMIRRMEDKLKTASEELFEYCGESNPFLRYCRKWTYHLYWIRKLKAVENWV